MYILGITLKDIDAYLIKVKNAIRKNRYRIEMNSRRQDNRELFLTYVIDEEMAKMKKIIISRQQIFLRGYKMNTRDMKMKCCMFLGKM